MTVETTTYSETETRTQLSFLWLEIIGKCQLACEHCYADSGPTGTHGSMSRADWCQVIDEAAELGVEMVQLIGGEPTLHPDLPALVRHALNRGIDVEVFSNLVRISAELWNTFELPGVRLATSYYSTEPTEHESITGRTGSYAKTLHGIVEALRRDIPLRVGVLGLRGSQDVDQACRKLAELGVTDLKVDHLRQVGRGIRDGEVWPGAFSRWMPVGNVRECGLTEVLSGSALASVRADLAKEFDDQRSTNGLTACNPKPHVSRPRYERGDVSDAT